MIWLWHTRFSRYLVAAVVLTRAAAATIEGSVDLRSKSGERAKDASNVLISLTPRDSRSTPAPLHAKMIQRGKTFSPHLLVIGVGGTVDFPNLDPIFHNAFSNFNGEVFDIGLYSPGQSRSILFRRPGIVRVFCNIHPTMSAVIAVLQTPYWAVTNREGEFVIRDVPPASYLFQVFEEQATAETLTGLSKIIAVTEGANRLPAVRLDQSDFLPSHHQNKYGQDYPREASDYGTPK
jgi:plastocyanin